MKITAFDLLMVAILMRWIIIGRVPEGILYTFAGIWIVLYGIQVAFDVIRWWLNWKLKRLNRILAAKDPWEQES